MWIKSFVRSLENPSTPLSDPASWLWDALGARKSATGISVTPESSLQTTTVWAAVRMISSTIGSLPLHTYQRTDAGKDRAQNHPVYSLLQLRPNPEQSAFVWKETMLGHLLLYGNFYCEIERNGRGDPIALWPLPPTKVRTERLGQEKVYVVQVDGQDVPVSEENILHIPGFSLDGQKGLLPVSLARDAIGLAKATEEFGARFFENGASPSSVLRHPGKLGKEAQDRLRKSLAKYRGLSNAQRLMILEEGMEWEATAISQEAAQYLETRKFQVNEIARLFLIPPHLIGDLERATFSNIEEQSLSYVKYCIGPWTRRIEDEINWKLFSDRRHYAEFVLEELLRGDSAARADFYTKMFNIGVYSINEIRELENRNKLPEDKRMTPLNMTDVNGQEEEAA